MSAAGPLRVGKGSMMVATVDGQDGGGRVGAVDNPDHPRGMPVDGSRNCDQVSVRVRRRRRGR